MKNYRRSEASFALTFALGLYVKVKSQGRDITGTFTLPKIFHDGFYAKEGLQNKLKVRLKKLGESNSNLSQSITYDSRLYTLNLCRSAARILPLRQASSQMNND